jgi:uncharacterized cupin superfamily protein
MADVTVKRLEEFDAVFGGAMKRVRAGLGVKSFGMQVVDLPPNLDAYPEHAHSSDGQEEVYTLLEGAATLRVGDDTYELTPGVFARVGPGERRKFVTKEQPARILCLGGVPEQVYEPPQWSEEGAEPPRPP